MRRAPPLASLLLAAAAASLPRAAAAADDNVPRVILKLNLSSIAQPRETGEIASDHDIRDRVGDGGPKFVVEAGESESAACTAALDSAALRQVPSVAVCPDANVSQSLKLKSNEIATAFGRVEFHAAAGKFATVDSLTAENLLGNENATRENTAVLFGFVDTLFDGRLTLATDLSWANDSSTWRERGETTLGETTELSGAARWHRFEARLIDTPDIRWSASGEFSSIDDGYVANSVVRPRLSLSLRGERTRLSSTFKLFDAMLSGVMERSESTLQTRALDRLRLALDGLEIGISRLTVERSPLLDPGIRTSGSESTSLTLEVMPELLLPELSAAVPLMPDLVSLDWETGREADFTKATADRDVSGAQALLSWSGRFGETTALYWREAKRPLFGTDNEINQLLDVSHTVKHGDWRFGVGFSLFDLRAADGSDSFGDTNLSGSGSIAYAPALGPQFQLRVGHNTDEFAFEGEEAFRETASSLALSVSVDFSEYVQEAFDRPNITLRAEYRRNLRSVDAPDREAVDDEAEAFLATFAAPF